jgi:Glycine cleavage H-protein
VNTALAGQPDVVNRAPYENWLFRIKPDASNSTATLLDPVQYASRLSRDDNPSRYARVVDDAIDTPIDVELDSGDLRHLGWRLL